MTEIEFGVLTDLHLREAWKNEALDFTPWLAQNIDQLGVAIGITLELIETEVAVEAFAADILARNPLDDSAVLIENQLEQTDHTHLGQIMTYLAGLEAKTVIWIAPHFREPHLSAIRWLNEHTSDGFSFFAVRARAVRIDDSKIAPIFEVIEKPNDWERNFKSISARSKSSSGSEVTLQFWTEMLAKYPEMEEIGAKPARTTNLWITLSKSPDIVLSIFVGQARSGAFLRGLSGADPTQLHLMLSQHRHALEGEIGLPLEPNENGRFFIAHLPKGHLDKENWPEIMEWLNAMTKTYNDAIKATFVVDKNS